MTKNKNLINKIEFVSGSRAWAFCPYHNDNNRPNISITLSSEYYGAWKCWACGKHGKLSKVELNKLNLKEHEVYRNNSKMKTRWDDLAFSYIKKLNSLPLLKQGLANEFNVNPGLMNKWRVGYDGNAFTIPMYVGDNGEEICGIQRRFPNGKKCCVTGSKLGIMYPITCYYASDPLFICEGFSDAICVNDLGYNSIARPHCYFNDLDNYLAGYIWEHIIIIPDNDEVGVKGGQALCNYLYEAYSEQIVELTMITMEYKGVKDVRELIQKKGKDYVKTLLEDYING